MIGYLGYFTTRLFMTPAIASGTSGAIFYVIAQDGATPVYTQDQGAFDSLAACYFRFDLDVLSNQLPCTAKVQSFKTTGSVSADLIAQGDTTAAFDASGSTSKFYRIPYLAGGGGSAAYIRVNLIAGAGASDAFYEAIAKLKVYSWPGWKSVNLTAPSCLTNVEPGIVGTPMGRQAAASSYQNEIDRAKDLIGSRLLGIGIDLEAIPSDGVINIGASVNGFPQNLAANIVPELLDPATYLALALLHERWAQRPDDWDAYRAEYYRNQYEDSLASALKVLPVNLRKDWQQDKVETLREGGSRLAM